MIEWVWSDDLEAPVRCIDEATLWGRTTLEVIDGDGIVHHVSAKRIRRLDEVEHPARSLQRSAAIMKLADHLARPDTLTAHLSPTLLPLPHQISHVERALSSPTTRLLIADEVGLGKTISAALILRELLNRERIQRILILVPAGLVAQWILELRTHVGIEAIPLFTGLSPTPNAARVWTDYDIVITTHDAARPVQKRKGWSAARLVEHNAARFEGAISAPWDAVIIDEAHRMPGATKGVARHALASALAGASPHLLLLTGTPHQGKADQFHRLVEFLDPNAFPTPESVTRSQVERHLIRVDKKQAVDMDGRALFVDRATHLHIIPEEDRRASERSLELEMRNYIRKGYAMDREDRRGGHGFLMALFGRLLGSSTASLLSALQRRRMALLDQNLNDDDTVGEDEDNRGDIAFDSPELMPDELQWLNTLIGLARSVRVEGPDTKADSLIRLMRNLERLEKDPDVKMLIFTEFTATQTMLGEWLGRHGVSFVTLNGSMAIEQRLESLRAFKGESRVLISTEAGGEGLNLQFCHLVINYDLPWNPMRIEQRIGRVHRIGQQHRVTAYNMVLGGSTEARVLEVIEEKLEQIFTQLGVDKLSDVLDSSEVETDVDRLYRTAFESDDESAMEEAKNLFDDLLEKAVLARSETIIEPTAYDLDAIRERLSVPVLEWASMIDENSDGDIRHPSVISALSDVRPLALGESIPVIKLQGFPELDGWWTLWRIGVVTSDGEISRTIMMPLFVDGKGAAFTTAGGIIWDALLSNEPQHVSSLNLDESTQRTLRTQAEESGASVHASLWSETETEVQDELSRLELAHAAQAAAISHLGLVEVRQFRMSKLDDRTAQHRSRIESKNPQGSRLEQLQIVRIVGGE
jgi:ERCC4-related helicase